MSIIDRLVSAHDLSPEDAQAWRTFGARHGVGPLSDALEIVDGPAQQAARAILRAKIEHLRAALRAWQANDMEGAEKALDEGLAS